MLPFLIRCTSLVGVVAVTMVTEMPTPPWIKPLLLSLGASVASSAVWVTTAKNRHRKAKRRRKQSTKPVVIGTVAKRDAAMEVEPPLTLADMKQGALSMVERVKALVTGEKRDPPPEILDKDGRVVRTGQRRRRRKQASWMDSARESMRQVVHEEVQQKVDQTGLGKAQEALQQAAGVAKDAIKKVQEAVPEDIEGKLSAAGKSLAAGAKRVGEAVRDGISSVSSSASTAAQDKHNNNQPLLPPTPSLSPAEALATPPVDTAPVVDRVAEGLKKATTWVQGPGTPGYTSSRRPSSGGDVVDAKDAPSKPPPR
jgi:hypothetical protein